MKRIQQQAVEHYDRMIAWVWEQSLRKCPDVDIMFDEIGEDWGGDSCPYCSEFECDNDKCPLHHLDKNHWCCNDLWYKMAYAKTWHTWLKYAKQVRQYIIDNG